METSMDRIVKMLVDVRRKWKAMGRLGSLSSGTDPRKVLDLLESVTKLGVALMKSGVVDAAEWTKSVKGVLDEKGIKIDKLLPKLYDRSKKRFEKGEAKLELANALLTITDANAPTTQEVEEVDVSGPRLSGVSEEAKQVAQQLKTVIEAFTDLGHELMKTGVIEAVKWTEEMVRLTGERYRPLIGKIHGRAKIRFESEMTKTASPVKVDSQVENLLEIPNFESYELEQAILGLTQTEELGLTQTENQDTTMETTKLNSSIGLVDLSKRIIIALAIGIMVGASLGFIFRTPYYYKLDDGDREEISKDDYREHYGDHFKKMYFNDSIAYFGGAIAFSAGLLIMFVPGMLKRKKQEG